MQQQLIRSHFFIAVPISQSPCAANGKAYAQLSSFDKSSAQQWFSASYRSGNRDHCHILSIAFRRGSDSESAVNLGFPPRPAPANQKRKRIYQHEDQSPHLAKLNRGHVMRLLAFLFRRYRERIVTEILVQRRLEAMRFV